MSTLIIFPTPLDATCTLTHDTGGWTLTGVPALHPSGRPGQAFTIPDSTPDQNGFQFTMTAPKKVFPVMRGILHLHPQPMLVFDDFHMLNATVTLPRLVLNGETLKQDVP